MKSVKSASKHLAPTKLRDHVVRALVLENLGDFAAGKGGLDGLGEGASSKAVAGDRLAVERSGTSAA